MHTKPEFNTFYSSLFACLSEMCGCGHCCIHCNPHV